MLPPIARWMSKCGRIRFAAPNLSAITLDLTTHLPDLRAHPLQLEVLLNGEPLSTFMLFRHSWLNLRLPVPALINSAASGKFQLEIRAGRTWRPRPTNDQTRDDRELSIAVCNIEIMSEPPAVAGG